MVKQNFFYCMGCLSVQQFSKRQLGRADTIQSTKKWCVLSAPNKLSTFLQVNRSFSVNAGSSKGQNKGNFHILYNSSTTSVSENMFNNSAHGVYRPTCVNCFFKFSIATEQCSSPSWWQCTNIAQRRSLTSRLLLAIPGIYKIQLAPGGRDAQGAVFNLTLISPGMHSSLAAQHSDQSGDGFTNHCHGNSRDSFPDWWCLKL